MDPADTLRLIEAIEKLNPEVIKKSNQRQMDPTVTLRLIEAIEKLKELNMESPFGALSERKKSFIEVSKAITLFAGAGLNALNVFVVAVVYMSKHMMLGNKGGTNTAPAGVLSTESASAPLSITQSILILGTMFYFLFTSYAVAVAHAAVHRREWFSKLVVMMILEIFLVNATPMLYAYLLTEGDF